MRHLKEGKQRNEGLVPLFQLKQDMKPYFTLLVRNGEAYAWEPVFGDYNKAAVLDERDFEYDGTFTKIIRTSESQQSITAAIALANVKYPPCRDRANLKRK